jgi:dihydrofolate synthase/folylpolyglutamate synthase
MLGTHQLRNISGVLKVLDLLNIDEKLLESSVRRVCPSLTIPGRLESIPNSLGFEIFIDVAHNEPAAEILSKQILGMRKVQRTGCILGMLSTKDNVGFLTHLIPLVDHFFLVELDHPDALSAEAIMEIAKNLDKKLETSCHSSCGQVLGEIFESNDFVDRLIITGSFVTVGEATRFFQESTVE